MENMGKVSVLVSGGLDSCVLMADHAQDSIVYPIYLQEGLKWEKSELKALKKFIKKIDNPNIQPLTIVQMPIAPFYLNHWSLTDEQVPGRDDPDSKVFLPGRNIILIGLAAVWCSTHDVNEVSIGSLDENPFPDATDEFFDEFGKILSKGLAYRVKVSAPYRGTKKHELIKKYCSLPLDLTLTCMDPQDLLHCGNCNKCRERQDAFNIANVEDLTIYRN